jgi:hypothetical protein
LALTKKRGICACHCVVGYDPEAFRESFQLANWRRLPYVEQAEKDESGGHIPQVGAGPERVRNRDRFWVRFAFSILNYFNQLRP